jgi:HEPN domain-containing protein
MRPDAGSPADWLRHAHSDLALARSTSDPQALREDLCFHTQQAAEKSFKAVLVARGLAVPRTHSLQSLIDLLPADITPPQDILLSARLANYAVSTRYPGDYEEITEGGYQEALRLATAVVAWAGSLCLPPDEPV